MRSPRSPSAPAARFRTAARACGAISWAVGLLVFVAWVARLPWLTTVGQPIAMAPTTAFLLTLGGAALWLLASEGPGDARRFLGRVLAALLAALATLILVEYLTELEVGLEARIDQLAPGRGEIHRVSFNAAFNLLLLAFAMLVLDLRARIPVADVLTLPVLLNAVIASSSYVFGTSPFYGLPGVLPVSGMALHTSLTMILLGFGVLAARPRVGVMRIITSELAGGQMIRPLLAAAAMIPLLGLLVMAGEHAGLYGPELRAPIAIGISAFVAAAAAIIAARGLNEADRERRAAEQRTLELEQQAAARQRFFAELGERLAESLDLQTTLENVVRAAVPYLADWAVIDLAEAHGPLRRAAIVHADPAKADLAAELLRRTPAPVRMKEGVHAAVAGTRSVLLRDLGPEWIHATAPDPRRAELLERMGVRSYVIVPMAARGRVVGALSFVAADRNFTEEQVRIAEEIARRAALYADNARLYTEAQQAIRLREDVVAMVSHDLRNPLNAIRLGLQILTRRLPPPEAFPAGSDPRKPLADVERATRRALTLIDQLLEFARIEAGNVHLDFEELPAAVLLDQVVALMGPLAAERRVVLEASTDQALRLRCDAARILRVLENLVGNAIKFSPPGAVVTVSASRRGEEAVFAVEDQGPGIAPEDAAHIFDRYWQPDRTRGEGTGLGLAIARGIVDAHGGSLSVRSELGRGSTFTFTVGAAPEVAASAGAPA